MVGRERFRQMILKVAFPHFGKMVAVLRTGDPRKLRGIGITPGFGGVPHSLSKFLNIGPYIDHPYIDQPPAVRSNRLPSLRSPKPVEDEQSAGPRKGPPLCSGLPSRTGHAKRV